MNVLRERFGRRTLFIAIHVQGALQAIRNAKLAQHAGADGVFLVNNDPGVTWGDVATAYAAVRLHCGDDFFIGVNLLEFTERPAEAVRKAPSDIDALWIDDAGISERFGATSVTSSIQCAMHFAGVHYQLFGGVAFKYRTEVTDYVRIAASARPYMSVITTSGAGTGEAPSIEKARLFREGAGDHAIVLASGINHRNVGQFLPYVDGFIVGTSVSSRDFADVYPARIERLAAKIHTRQP